MLNHRSIVVLVTQRLLRPIWTSFHKNRSGGVKCFELSGNPPEEAISFQNLSYYIETVPHHMQFECIHLNTKPYRQVGLNLNVVTML